MTARPNFGHHAAHGFGVFLDSWGDGPMVIRDGNRVWWFEFSDMFGPTILKPGKSMTPKDDQPVREDDPFWIPFQGWIDGGKRCRAIRSKRGRLRFWLCHWKWHSTHQL